MQQRLISENMIQCNYNGQPYFTTFGKYIAYVCKSDKDKETICIKIKTFSKQIRQCIIELAIKQSEAQSPNIHIFFAKHQLKAHLIVYDLKKFKLDIYNVSDNNQEIVVQKNQTFEKIVDAAQNNNLLLLVKQCEGESNYQIEGYDFKADTIQQNIGKISKQQIAYKGKLMNTQGTNIYFICQPAQQKCKRFLKVFKKKQNKKYQQVSIEIDHLHKVMLIYKDRFIFEQILKDKRQIQIFDINQQKIIGKFSIPQGNLIHYSLVDNILMLITNLSNIDRYHFYVLSKDIDHDKKGLITNLCQYEKGKGAYFQLSNYTVTQASNILQGKVKIGSENINSMVSLVHMIPRNKEKIQVMKINHEKLFENHFGEQTVDMVIQSKVKLRQTSKDQMRHKKQRQKVDMQHHRVEASQQMRKSQKNIEQIQAKLIEKLFDVKMKGIYQRFDRLQNKLNNLEADIRNIYEKIEKSLQTINQQEIKRNVQMLFDKVTPQFETYFNQVFRQIARVMDQGQTYFKGKLAKQADLHRDALSKMINMTFDATKEIIELGRSELKLSESTDKNVQKLIQIYDKWKQDNKNLTNSETSPKKDRADNPSMKISLLDHGKNITNK